MFFRKKRSPSEERREVPRRPIRNLVRIMRPGGEEIRSLSNAFDLSETGLCLVCFENFEPGTPLRVVINLPAAEKNLEVGAKVAWSREMKGREGSHLAGLEFIRLAAEDRRLIRIILGEEGE